MSGDIKIIQLQEVNVQNKRELQKIENEYICKEIGNPLCLNTFRSFVSEEQLKEERHRYREQNKEYLNEQMKLYRINNIEKIKEMRKQYSSTNKDKIKEGNHRYYEQNKEYLSEQMKLYKINHSEKIKELRRQYSSANKEKIRAKKSIKYSCCCGSENILYDHKSRHERSQKHLNFLNNQSKLEEK